MNPKDRFIKSIIYKSQNHKTAMPWSRGACRSGFIKIRRDTENPAHPAKPAELEFWTTRSSAPTINV